MTPGGVQNLNLLLLNTKEKARKLASHSSNWKEEYDATWKLSFFFLIKICKLKMKKSMILLKYIFSYMKHARILNNSGLCSYKNCFNVINILILEE